LRPHASGPSRRYCSKSGSYRELRDIVYVKPEDFDPGKTMLQADQIGEINRELARADRKYY
jgi:hypothetical protein